MTLTISIGRAQLGLSPLVIVGSKAAAAAPGASGLWIPAGGYVRPRFQHRRTFAPDSAYVPDRQPLAAVLDEGTWVLAVHARAADDATLSALRSVLSFAVGQWSYLATVTLDGVEETWSCRTTWPTWPEAPYWRRQGHEDRAVLTIPVKVP